VVRGGPGVVETEDGPMTDDELREMKETGLRGIADLETHVIRGDRTRPALVLLFLADQIRGAVADVESAADRGEGFKATTIANQMDALSAVYQAAVDAYGRYRDSWVQ
jgi:hypothetical protein